MPSGMMGDLPFRINNGSLSDLHNAVTGTEASRGRGVDHIYVCPLQAVVVNVICDFAK